ncbi:MULTISPECIES: DUF2852 domain-containing protein [Roseobacteraceae]|uniref:DUF2852 domain-containing protein n=1 Tax=Roseobacteraceae TaxID=2854170 RepID=UPI00125ECDCD|nr:MULTISPECIES: DUF2852 domain-containing protein [Roseobacteraceae]KAB6715136.1 hypothetical protein C8029_17040 [Roseobacter sp. TSBP12]|tara:strand:+ start:433 stop:927 length:495 start_codon:yes stop_codon:yes gene_type:complete
MTDVTSTYTAQDRPMGWFRRAEGWLDDKGKGAWIAAMVLGFVFVWPVGLALLFYMIWGKKMFACKNRSHHRTHRCGSHGETFRAARAAARPSGNSAFDAYKTETLMRLEEEQDQFESFLERLRAAKDKAEFDQFMEDRVKKASEARAKDHDAKDHDESADKEDA